MSQKSPVQPEVQIHMKLFCFKSTHVAPFPQGFQLAQAAAFTSSKQSKTLIEVLLK